MEEQKFKVIIVEDVKLELIFARIYSNVTKEFGY